MNDTKCQICGAPVATNHLCADCYEKRKLKLIEHDIERAAAPRSRVSVAVWPVLVGAVGVAACIAWREYAPTPPPVQPVEVVVEGVEETVEEALPVAVTPPPAPPDFVAPPPPPPDSSVASPVTVTPVAVTVAPAPAAPAPVAPVVRRPKPVPSAPVARPAPVVVEPEPVHPGLARRQRRMERDEGDREKNAANDRAYRRAWR